MMFRVLSEKLVLPPQSFQNSPPTVLTVPPRSTSTMRVSCFLALAITAVLACVDATTNPETSTISKVASPGLDTEVNAIDSTQRFLRTYELDEDNSDDLKTTNDSDDEEERDLIIPALDRHKYKRWFKAHMRPEAVKQVLGLTGLRPLVKPIKRRVYKGYVVYYEEHCQRPQYRKLKFCQPGSE
ncbi:unnamed protein product [Phytophthora lilii]|uniref:RxLR effector protein n=1 Tax=Phytophthora lilii TaxID=2077276 RepID=A0A9W6XKZ1_9STRA|nr:unnamed protein product [Phytophthora lilii]